MISAEATFRSPLRARRSRLGGTAGISFPKRIARGGLRPVNASTVLRYVPLRPTGRIGAPVSCER